MTLIKLLFKGELRRKMSFKIICSMLVPWRVKSAYCTVLEFDYYKPKEDGGRFQEDEC